MKRRNFIGKVVGLLGVGFLLSSPEVKAFSGLPSTEDLVAEIQKYGYKRKYDDEGIKLSETKMIIYNRERDVSDTVRVYQITDIHGKNPVRFVQRFYEGIPKDGKLHSIDTQGYMTENWRTELHWIMTHEPKEL